MTPDVKITLQRLGKVRNLATASNGAALRHVFILQEGRGGRSHGYEVRGPQVSKNVEAVQRD